MLPGSGSARVKDPDTITAVRVGINLNGGPRRAMTNYTTDKRLRMGGNTVPPAVERVLTEELEMAHLGTAVNDRPHVAPVWYRYEADMVEFVTEGKKLENIRANPKVALSIEHSENGHGQWHVVLFGTARIITEESQLWAGRTRLFQRYRNREPSLEEDGEPPEALVKVDIGSVSYDI